MNVRLRDYVVKTYGIARTDPTLLEDNSLPEGIDFIFVGSTAGLKRLAKICRRGDKVIPVGDMKLSRLTRLALDRAGITVVD